MECQYFNENICLYIVFEYPVFEQKKWYFLSDVAWANQVILYSSRENAPDFYSREGIQNSISDGTYNRGLYTKYLIGIVPQEKKRGVDHTIITYNSAGNVNTSLHIVYECPVFEQKIWSFLLSVASASQDILYSSKSTRLVVSVVRVWLPGWLTTIPKQYFRWDLKQMSRVTVIPPSVRNRANRNACR